MRRTVLTVLVVLATSLVAACGQDGPTRSYRSSPPVDAGVGLVAEVVADGLVGPTQIAGDGRGGYVVAELNGGERDGTGRVVHFETLPGEPRVLVDGLLAPTGVAVEGDRLWIMERRTLSVASLDDPSDRRVVLDQLPFNGRSQGTISVAPDGGIVYDTSGRRLGGGRLVEGSGVLWSLAGPDATPEPLATGFKHAYAHAPLGDGRWLVTEISDGRLDGEVPPDELVVARRGDDFAYPRCIGDRVAVAEVGGTDEECRATPPSLALFEPGATPTGVAIAPWDPDLALVALWVAGDVVAVPIDEPSPGRPPGAVPVSADTAVSAGLGRPQHLLADGDRVLVTDHDGGRVLALAPAPS